MEKLVWRSWFGKVGLEKLVRRSSVLSENFIQRSLFGEVHSEKFIWRSLFRKVCSEKFCSEFFWRGSYREVHLEKFLWRCSFGEVGSEEFQEVQGSAVTFGLWRGSEKFDEVLRKTRSAR